MVNWWGVPDAQEGSEAGGGDAGGGGGYQVRVKSSKPLPARLAGQDVRLTVTAAASEGEVLVVPVSAFSSGADGKTVVTVRDKGGEQRRVEVATGTTGDGFVAVRPLSGGTLGEGEKVVVGVRKDAA